MSRIILPENFKKIITEPSYVEKGINRYWNNHQYHIKKWLGGYLKGSKETYLDLESSGIEKGFSTNLDNPKFDEGAFRSILRHFLGYNALPGLLPSNLGFQIWSSRALVLRETIPKAKGIIPKKLENILVVDHFVGTTAAAARLFKTYRDSGWDLPYILNEWLPKEIINYITIVILHDEHQENRDTGKKGIARGDVFTLEEKLEGLHYMKADIKLPLIVTNKNANRINMENNDFKYPLVEDLSEHPFFDFKV